MSHRHAIIVPTAIAANCNQVAAFLGIDPAALLNTLSVPLVPASGLDGAAATHMACSGQLTEEQRDYLESNQDAFPGAKWWRWHDDATPTLAASYDGQHLGEDWSWERCLEVAGLKRQNLSQL